MPKPKVPGLLKGMGVTFNEMTQTIWPHTRISRSA